MKSTEAILPVAFNLARVSCSVKQKFVSQSTRFITQISCCAETSLKEKIIISASDSNGILCVVTVLVRPCSVGGDNREKQGEIVFVDMDTEREKKNKTENH